MDAYRAPMRSSRALADGVVGVRRSEGERDDARLDRFCAVPEGSFVWTRLDGAFHLGRVTGGCRHEASDASDEADELVHVRPCDWERVDAALVPEQVRHAFSRGGRNFQRIGLAGAADATVRVWELLG